VSESIDLTGLMGDAEPTTVRVGEAVYTVDPNAPAVFVERVVKWCNGLLIADEAQAEREAIDLVARAYQVERSEAEVMTPRLRRSMLTFFVNGPFLLRQEAQP
jgi:hypothetical protein